MTQQLLHDIGPKFEISRKLSELQTSFIPEILEWFSENVEKCISDASLCPMLVRLMKHDNHVMKGEENLLVTLQAAIAKKVECNIFVLDAIFFVRLHNLVTQQMKITHWHKSM